jgi:hypothetical protein
MFTCPQCHRPARVLYARWAYDRIWFFSCRKCAGITYQSTMGHRWDRSARRVEKLRARLKWGAGGTVPIKPRGMLERTYQRILGMIAYQVTRESTDQSSIVLTCGGNAEIDLLTLVVGQFVDEADRQAGYCSKKDLCPNCHRYWGAKTTAKPHLALIMPATLKRTVSQSLLQNPMSASLIGR